MHGYDEFYKPEDEYRGMRIAKFMKKKYKININEFKNINPFDRTKPTKPKIEYEFVLMMNEFLVW